MQSRYGPRPRPQGHASPKIVIKARARSPMQVEERRAIARQRPSKAQQPSVDSPAAADGDHKHQDLRAFSEAQASRGAGVRLELSSPEFLSPLPGSLSRESQRLDVRAPSTWFKVSFPTGNG